MTGMDDCSGTALTSGEFGASEELHTCAKHADLNWLLHRAAQKLGSALQDEATRFGVSIRGQLVLTALAADESAVPRTQLALGQVLGLDKTTLTGELDRLEQRGLVVRRPDPTDRRARIPEITDTGRALQAKTEAALRQAEERFNRAFSPEEQLQLRALLHRLAYLEVDDPGSCI